MAVYIYYPDQSQVYGDAFYHSGYLTPGEINRICLNLKLNTVGHSNGIIKLSLNGDVDSYFNFEFRKTQILNIDTAIFETFFGGGDSSFAPESDQYLDFDNLKVLINL